MSQTAVQDRARDDVEEDFEAEPEAQNDAHAGLELHTSILPAPTMPASMLADVRPEEQGGGGCMGIPNAFGGSRAESVVNKKPFALIKLGHRLCGFVR